MFQRIIIYTYLVVAFASWAQRAKVRYQNQSFLDHQFWVGLRLGSNLSKAKPLTRYTLFSAMEGKSAQDYEKKYRNFNKTGFDLSVDLYYDYKGFGVFISPGYSRNRFSYENNFTWTDTSDASFHLEQKNTTTQSLDYVILPVAIRYAPRQLRFRPIVMVGMYYGVLFSAVRNTQVQKIDYASGGMSTYDLPENTIGNKNLFLKSNLGWFAQIGASYPLGNVRLSLELYYKRNIHVLTNKQNRYSDLYISNDTDLPDDLKLRNLGASMSVAIPLRFLSTSDATSEL
ncbi:MAG: hypothetical protein U0V72_11475 [Cytophagales bacterium]